MKSNKSTISLFDLSQITKGTTMQNQVVEEKPASNERIDYIDFLRVIALCMAVTIHVSAFFLDDATVGSKNWMVAHFFDTLSRPAVPVFIMVSGLLQLSSDQALSLIIFLKKRSFRVIFPLFSWSVIYVFWSSINTHEVINLKAFLLNILSGNVYYHLYFLYMIFGLYLLTPLLKVFIAQAKKQDFLYAIGLWILAVSVFSLLKKFWGIRFYYLLIPITGYIGYYLAGYFLSTIPLVKNSFLLIIWMIANLATFLGTWVISNKTGELDEFFYGYTSLTVIASAFTLFIYIKQLDVSGFYTRFPNLKKFISLAASTSFSVYLIHLIILEMLYVGTLGITIDSNTFNPIIGIPLIVAIVSIFSGLIVLTLRRIPIIRWFFP